MDFDPEYPVSFAQGRRGEVYIFQGHGRQGLIRRADGSVVNVGLEPPTQAPDVVPQFPGTFYVARVDIIDAGNGYHLPPQVTISPPAGGGRQAKAICRLESGQISEISVTDGGVGYSTTPVVKISDEGTNPSTGAGAQAAIALQEGHAEGDYKTGVVYWELIEGGNGFSFLQCDGKGGRNTKWKNGYIVNACGGSGSGAKLYVELTEYGRWYFGVNDPKPKPPDTCGVTYPSQCELTQDEIDNQEPGLGSLVQSIQVYDFGSGYRANEEVYAYLQTASTLTNLNGTLQTNCSNYKKACPGVVRGYVYGSDDCPDNETCFEASPARSRPINATVANGGSGYLLPPRFVTSDGEVIETEIDGNGSIVKLILTNPNKKYLWPPEIIDDSGGVGGGKGIAIVRAVFRGKYQCYYRYVDESLPESQGGPLYSSLSPVTEVDCKDGAAKITWRNIPVPAGKALELWRSASNQATTLFRVAKIGGTKPFGSLIDTLSDWDLVNTGREGWLAMPILLSDGSLNANRFGTPSKDFAVGVLFQDRLFLGVDTTGKRPNTLLFSEADEPESIPEINELIIQTNLRSTDYVTALVPYSGALIAMQSRHSHRITFVQSPAKDASSTILSYRGCLNQRCWDIYDGVLYAMDDQGVYALQPNGSVEGISLAIDSLFRENTSDAFPTIDFSLRRWFMVRADRNQNVLRVFVALRGDGAKKYPTRQYVYSFDYKSGWDERYPQEITAATEARVNGQVMLACGGTEGLVSISSGLTDIAVDSISSVEIVNKGRGYRKPPKIVATGGHGAEFECGIDANGSITGISVRFPGANYTPGFLQIEAPPEDGEQATARYYTHSGTQPVSWAFKSGNFAFETDMDSKGGGSTQRRTCSVTYQPTKEQCDLELKTYYNGSNIPRSNVVRRDRGTGFVHSDVLPSATLNMKATPLQDAECHGVASALFSGKVLEDIMGSDRHVAVELSGKQDQAGPVAIHSLEINGVSDNGAA